MIELMIGVIALVPLDLLPLHAPASPSAVPVAPMGSNGFAAGILGGVFGLGLICLAAFLLGLKPRRAQPPPRR